MRSQGAHLKAPLSPNYPAYSRSRGEEGEVLLEALIRPDGTVVAITTARSSGHDALDAAAAAAQREATFTWDRPPPQSVKKRLAVQFRLQPAED